MLTIRLFRFGTKNRPSFRIAVAEKTKDTHGDYLEAVGHYNPRSNPKIITIEQDRVKYWISVGAQPSPTVHNLLVSQGILSAEKKHAFHLKKKPQDAKSAPTAKKTA